MSGSTSTRTERQRAESTPCKPQQHGLTTNSTKWEFLWHATVIETSEPPSSSELGYIHPAEDLVHKPWEKTGVVHHVFLTR